MASNWTVCGVCNFKNINKASVVWCSECDEGLCVECREHHGASKSTRNHDTISITEYQKLPTNVLEITQTCQKHKEHYQTFCKKHDCPCCRRCVIETHNGCTDLTAIEDIVKNVKSSNAWLEVEQILVQMLENVRRIRNDRTENLKCLQDQRVKIERDIKQTRKMINDHLDKIQDKIIKELYVNEENESKRIQLLLCEIEDIEKGISDLQGNQNNIRQHASELQTFLALKHIEKEVSDKEECILSVLKSEDMKIKTLSLEINKEVQNICRVESFGSVGVESNLCKVVISENKCKQAQIMVPTSTSKCVDDLKITKQIQINLPSASFIRGCTLLPSGKMMFSDQARNKIIASNNNGLHDFEIALDIKPCDIAFIETENTIAVTSGYGKKVIHIIDLKSKKMKRSIKTSANPFGITLNKNAIVYCKIDNGIMKIQLNSESEKTIVSLDMSAYSYVAVHDDNIYYTNKDRNTVSCYEILGNLKWTFKDEENMQYPQGISVDNNGNVYVVSTNTNSVVIITPDGKRCRTILSSRDGLSFPRALHFEPISNKLLVANETDFAFLFDVS
ncbi:tripartite motif-containing protein 2-like [Mytilus edulis]|uniref:tripartite motif-containing protein 2-like n=1 Tax=Mytilus edulis TaxID=6550 RepID=UPI0039EE4870